MRMWDEEISVGTLGARVKDHPSEQTNGDGSHKQYQTNQNTKQEGTIKHK